MKEKKLHVLLAEAHPDETASALRALYPEKQDGLELTNVSSVSTLIATLEIVNPDVIFLDLSIAQVDPLDGVRRVHRSAPAVPLVVLADTLAVDAAEPSAPVLSQRLEKRIAMLNRDIGPWGPLELHSSVRFWSPQGEHGVF
jgi:two-component SAPR family response regulator